MLPEHVAKQQTFVPLIFGWFNTTYLTRGFILTLRHHPSQLWLTWCPSWQRICLQTSRVQLWNPQLKWFQQFWISPATKQNIFCQSIQIVMTWSSLPRSFLAISFNNGLWIYPHTHENDKFQGFPQANHMFSFDFDDEFVFLWFQSSV